MNRENTHSTSQRVAPVDRKLAAYLAGGAGISLAAAAETDAAIVGSLVEQPFGINGDVNIDFNNDGQIDFQIDHDRIDQQGQLIDYLQIDKNDINSAANPLPIDAAATFPVNGTGANDTTLSQYVVNGVDTGHGTLGAYPAALQAGDLIDVSRVFDFQEGDNFNNTGNTIRANRLIDEDQTQIDQAAGTTNVQAPFDGPNFVGLNGEVRYVGVRFEPNGADLVHHGWIGIRIDNEADATGAVVGYAYNDVPLAPIAAGQVPEPSTMLLAAAGGAACWSALRRKR